MPAMIDSASAADVMLSRDAQSVSTVCAAHAGISGGTVADSTVTHDSTATKRTAMTDSTKARRPPTGAPTP
jgi:hypothetical protein